MVNATRSTLKTALSVPFLRNILLLPLFSAARRSSPTSSYTRATELLDLHRQGRGSEAHASLDGLHTLRDSLLAQLRCLLLEA